MTPGRKGMPESESWRHSSPICSAPPCTTHANRRCADDADTLRDVDMGGFPRFHRLPCDPFTTMLFRAS